MKYTISILSYTELDRVKACVKSVLENSTDFKLILTANGPVANDYFLSLAKANPGIVTVVLNPQNEGFIGPNNHAFALCDTPYFVCLNDDTEVPPGWLQALEAPLREHANAALSGPRGTCCALRNNFDGYHGDFEYLEGSCLMVKCDLVRPHGLFSTYLTKIYAEDSDLSLRMRRLGYTIHQVDFHLKHARQATTRKIPGIDQIRKRNAMEVRKRFRHYLKVRRFDYPIVVRRGGAIGDVILTVPIVHALRRDNPLCPIFIETRHPEVYQHNPDVQGAGQITPGAQDRNTLLIDLDMAYENRPHTNIVNAYADIAGLGQEYWMPSLYLHPGDQSFANGMLSSPNSWCAIHIGPTWPGKTWPPARWAAVVDHLKALGFKILSVGTSAGSLPFVPDLDLRGGTTLHQLAALINNCVLFVGIDSMPMHVAIAMGTTTVALFGVSLPEYVLPTGIGQGGHRVFPVVADRTHRYTGMRHRVKGQTFIACRSNPMETISPEMVTQTVDAILKPIP